MGCPPTSWRPSDNPLYKVNFDGALFDSEQRAGWGVVIRNVVGQVVVSLSERALLPFTAIEVEAMAARQALVLALQNNSLLIPLWPHSKRHALSCFLIFRNILFPFM